jgi:hypothetical protein
VYAISRTGRVLSAISVRGASNVDWEDMARAAGRLWIGDIGDNGVSRSAIQLYWFAQPKTDSVTSVTASMVTLHYPDGAHNAEAMIVDGANDAVYVLEKQAAHATSAVYRGSLDGVSPGDTVDLSLVASVPLTNITGADLGRDGIVIRSYLQTLFFPRPRSGGVVATLRRRPCAVLLPSSEAVAFSIDGSRIYSIPEGNEPRISYTSPR